MTPVHHVPEEELVEYSAGTSSEPAALAIACHAAFCGACVARLRGLDALGGAALAATNPQPTAPGALDSLLARLDGAPIEAIPVDSGALKLLDALGIPRVVLPYLPVGAADAGWRRLVPGITRIDLRAGSTAAVVRLVTLKPGLEIPLHDHGGAEYTVIFTGALVDDQGRFARGDISIRAAGERHLQHVEAGEPCVALVINEGRLEPLTWKGKVLSILAGG
jgi:putative transcriptional regulator